MANIISFAALEYLEIIHIIFDISVDDAIYVTYKDKLFSFNACADGVCYYDTSVPLIIMQAYLAQEAGLSATSDDNTSNAASGAGKDSGMKQFIPILVA